MDLMQGAARKLTSTEMEAFATAIHETWRALLHAQGRPMPPSFDKPYTQLAEIDRAGNRAAARRMPRVLAAVGLGLRRNEDNASPALSPDKLKAQLEQNLERLAEIEHDGWMKHRSRNGWRYAETRDDARKLHPDMVPYAQLPETEKNKDRDSIRAYPAYAALAGYQIVPIGYKKRFRSSRTPSRS
jgi:hypothetical protein